MFPPHQGLPSTSVGHGGGDKNPRDTSFGGGQIPRDTFSEGAQTSLEGAQSPCDTPSRGGKLRDGSKLRDTPVRRGNQHDNLSGGASTKPKTPLVCKVGEIYPIPAKDISTVTASLRSIKWTRRPRPYDRGDGFCVGATQNPRGSGIFYWTTREQRSATMAVNAALARMRIPGLSWSSLQFNYNTVSEPRVDKTDVGLLAILLLGEFTGGSLRVADGPFRSPPGKSGIAAVVNGCATHRSDPFRGERFSVVAFVHRACDRLSDKDRARLTAMGFCLPSRPSVDMGFCLPSRPSVVHGATPVTPYSHPLYVQFSSKPAPAGIQSDTSHSLLRFVEHVVGQQDLHRFLDIIRS